MKTWPTLAERSRRLNAAAARTWRKTRRAPFGKLPPVILLTDMRRLPDPLAAAAGLPRGAAVVVRHTDPAGRRALALQLRPLCRRRHLKLLIANDWHLAAQIGADGVHLAEAQLPHAGRRAWPARWLVTSAAHSLPALVRARRAGADAALLSPVFPTGSHPGARTLGPLRFAALAHRAPLPVYALGGVDVRNARRLHAAAGIAAISALA
jgi:thiamine-phosphate pyrophosphorylase